MLLLSTFLTTLTSIAIICLTFAFLIGVWFVAKPYFYVHYYKKQGAQGYFKFMGGFFHDRMKDARQDGDFMHYFKEIILRSPRTRAIVSNVGSKPMLFLTDPELIKEFLNQPHCYRKVSFISGVEGLFEGQGILFSEGETWKKQRKLLTGAFHNELIKGQVPLMATISDGIYSTIGKTENTRDLTHINITKQNQKVAGDILGHHFFGPNYIKYSFEGRSLTMGLRKLLDDGFKQMYTIWNGVLGAWFIRAGILPKHRALMERIEDFRDKLKAIIRETRRSGSSNTEKESYLLKVLLEQQDQAPETAMTDEEIIDNFISLFLAGTDPTGNLTSMILYYLSENPRVYEKVMKEIEEVTKTSTIMTFDQAQRMDYTLAVIKETLRKANPQGLLVFREALDDHNIGDFKVLGGTLVTYSPIFAGYNRRYYQDFDNFRPERWIAGEEKTVNLKATPFAFIPFSAGPRVCVGQHLALLQVKVMLTTFLKKFKPGISSDYNLKMTNRGTYEPLKSMKMSLTTAK